jgi:hypothetical protein
MDRHDRRHHHVGVSQDQGGLVSLERHRLRGRRERVAAVPEPPGRIQLEAAPVLLGVDYEHPTRADHQVVEVGPAPGDGQVMQNRPPVPLQWAEQAGGASLPGRPAPPGDGLRTGLEPQPQPTATAASAPRTR